MIKTRSSNKIYIKLTDEEFIKQKNLFKIKMKISLSILENVPNKKQKVKEAIKIIKITQLYSNIIFNYNDSGLLKFSKCIKDKYLYFIKEEPDEKELVFACKKFLDKNYDDVNFNLNCEAYTLNGLRCKHYKKEKNFCHIHDKKYVNKITEILTLYIIPDIARICISKLF